MVSYGPWGDGIGLGRPSRRARAGGLLLLAALLAGVLTRASGLLDGGLGLGGLDGLDGLNGLLDGLLGGLLGLMVTLASSNHGDGGPLAHLACAAFGEVLEVGKELHVIVPGWAKGLQVRSVSRTNSHLLLGKGTLWKGLGIDAIGDGVRSLAHARRDRLGGGLS